MKRDEIKYLRDLAKKHYNRGYECYICGTTSDLQFHHFYTVHHLWEKWKKERNLQIENVEHMIVQRELFLKEHLTEMYEETVTLCKFHHMDKLHKLYGKTPPLHTAMKQKRWCDIQRNKHKEAKA